MCWDCHFGDGRLESGVVATASIRYEPWLLLGVLEVSSEGGGGAEAGGVWAAVQRELQVLSWGALAARAPSRLGGIL